MRMACSQYLRCHTPRSRFETRLAERRSPPGMRREKLALTAPSRTEKSSSPCGNVMTQCRWSGNTTTASRRNGWRVFTCLTASRKTSICLTNKPRLRSARLRVKKYVPPGSLQRRYSVIVSTPRIIVRHERWASLRSTHPTLLKLLYALNDGINPACRVQPIRA